MKKEETGPKTREQLFAEKANKSYAICYTPKSNDADFQTMKRMAIEKMKTFTKEEYMRIEDIKIKR